MAVIAVAGGTGNVGRSLVEAIVAAGKHDVKILARNVTKRHTVRTRTANPELEKQLGASIIVVNYADVEATTKALEDNDVHTVISAINMMPPTGEAPKEFELIQAADSSKATKSQINRLGSVPHKLRAKTLLKETKDLEYTLIHNGFFLDYWGLPAVKSNMTPFTLVVDIPGNAASIPGSGNTPVAFTHTTDVAKYVAAALDLEKWEPETYIVADKVTWNEFVQLAEAAKGTKFSVTYDSVEKLKTGEVTELPSQFHAYPFFPKAALQGLVSTFGLWFEDGSFDLPPAGTKTLNEVFPDIKPWTVKNLLETAWKRA
ncbi:Isoflavone reductase IRL 2-like protein [Colletotrichum chlorophyti]|uniref:Isoflavone reductase IRL 2-like protein n=1 Tax=Colletotrichum chlorophyti TaxID=708187 RepID=A0A1Q8RZU8_9PEZI|nr:Isoflavone reductase IRL 2-like protein [Colletotrichum chlorophyti]